MDTEPTATGLLELLMRRQRLVELLAEAPRTQSDLVAESAASQPTVSRAIARLRSADLVRDRDGEYALTRLGRLLFSRYRSWLAEIEDVYEAADVVETVPDDVPDELFVDSTTVRSTTARAPDSAIEPLLRVPPEATRLRACASVVWTTLARRVTDRIVDDGLQAEVVLSADLLERDGPPTVDLRPAHRTGRLALYAADHAEPYDFSITETPSATYVGLIVRTGADGWSTVVSTNDRAVEWATDEFRRRKAAAERWAPPSGGGAEG